MQVQFLLRSYNIETGRENPNFLKMAGNINALYILHGDLIFTHSLQSGDSLLCSLSLKEVVENSVKVGNVNGDESLEAVNFKTIGVVRRYSPIISVKDNLFVCEKDLAKKLVLKKLEVENDGPKLKEVPLNLPEVLKFNYICTGFYDQGRLFLIASIGPSFVDGTSCLISIDLASGLHDMKVPLEDFEPIRKDTIQFASPRPGCLNFVYPVKYGFKMVDLDFTAPLHKIS